MLRKTIQQVKGLESWGPTVDAVAREAPFENGTLEGKGI